MKLTKLTTVVDDNGNIFQEKAEEVNSIEFVYENIGNLYSYDNIKELAEEKSEQIYGDISHYPPGSVSITAKNHYEKGYRFGFYWCQKVFAYRIKTEFKAKDEELNSIKSKWWYKLFNKF